MVKYSGKVSLRSGNVGRNKDIQLGHVEEKML